MNLRTTHKLLFIGTTALAGIAAATSVAAAGLARSPSLDQRAATLRLGFDDVATADTNQAASAEKREGKYLADSLTKLVGLHGSRQSAR